jgi:hypothetical protein
MAKGQQQGNREAKKPKKGKIKVIAAAPSQKAALLLQERPVDQLDMDAAVLHGLDRVGDLHQLARGGFWIGVGAGLDEFHHARFICQTSNLHLRSCPRGFAT